MVNLFDIMRQAQGGAGLQSLSRQFGLDGQSTQRALEALLPAFSLAFLRNAQDPRAFAAMLDLMTSGRFAPAFDGSGSARLGGEDILRTLFGSGDVTRRIADQASAMTGIGVQVLQQMMPVLAATLVGGMFRYASVEGFADLLKQWSDALKAAAPPAPRPAPPQAANPWSAWFEMMSSAWGGSPAPSPPPPREAANPFETWARLMSTMMGQGGGAPPAPPPPSRPNPFEALSRMFEVGRDVQAQNFATFQAILDGASRAAAPR